MISIPGTASAWINPVKADQKSAPLERGSMQVRMDTNALFAHKNGEVREVRVAPDRTLAIKGIRVLEGFEGARTWVGVHEEEGGSYQVFITEHNGAVFGVIYGYDTVYDLKSEPGKATAILRDKRAAGIGRAVVSENDYTVPPPPNRDLLEQQRKSASQPAIEPFASPAPQSTIDLLVVYTPDLLTRHGNAAGVTARINNLIAQTNTAYLNSDVAITLRLVGTLATTYTDTNQNKIALDEITPTIPGFPWVNTPPPPLSTVAATRNATQADIVVLLRPFRRVSHDSCGEAWKNSAVGFDIAGYDGWAYAVISEGADLDGVTGACDDMVFAHELGHVMGMDHERQNATNVNPPVTSYAYGFGYGFNAPGCAAGLCNRPTVGDVMSIPTVTRLACFSGPNTRQLGSSTTCSVNVATGNTVLGVAADTPPEACASTALGCPGAAPSCATNTTCADSARALNYVRVKVAAWRETSYSGTVQIGSSPVNSISACTSDPNILCTTSNGQYRCTGPAGWTGSIHLRSPNALIPAVVVNAPTNTSVTLNISAQAPNAFPNCYLDVDGNGLLEPARDGLAIMRRFMGFAPNGSNYAPLAGVCATNTTEAALHAAAGGGTTPVTGGAMSSASNNGLVILRAMQGLTGTAVTQGAVPSGSARSQWNSPAGANNNIREWLNTYCGSSFAP